jgi:hypothetical protein
MDKSDSPNRASNMDKAEGEKWHSDPATVERRDSERRESGAPADEPGAGISNRSVKEERENQAALPQRGDAKEGANAGRGHSDRQDDKESD